MAQEARPYIIFMHGRAQMRYSDEELDKKFLGTFREALQAAGAPDLIRPEDYELVKYQDLYREGATVSCPRDDAKRSAVLSPLENRRDAALAKASVARAAAVTQEAALGRVTDKIVAGRTAEGKALSAAELQALAQGLQEAKRKRDAALLEALTAESEAEQARRDILAAAATADAEEAQLDAKWPRFTKIGWDKLMEALTSLPAGMTAVQKTLLALVMTDTRSYIENRRVNCATVARLDAAIMRAGARPIILVTHSMGSLVAYDRVFDADQGVIGPARPALDLRRFVTVGSQLGVEDIVRAMIGDFRPLPVPASFRSWTNIRGEDDWVAPRRVDGHYEKRVAPPFSFAEYRIPTIPGDPHAIEGYLKNPAVLRAIVYSWCDSFTPAARPKGCTTFDRDVQPGDGNARLIAKTDL
jgi:hypothetical protein